jgi:hypothetical protein
VNSMRTKILLFLMALLSVGAGIAGELERVEKVLTSSKGKLKVRALLVELKLLKKWTQEQDEKILLDTGSSFGTGDRTYRARGYKEIQKITLAGKTVTEVPETWANFEVTWVEVETLTHSHTYQWKDDVLERVKSVPLPDLDANQEQDREEKEK